MEFLDIHLSRISKYGVGIANQPQEMCLLVPLQGAAAKDWNDGYEEVPYYQSYGAPLHYDVNNTSQQNLADIDSPIPQRHQVHIKRTCLCANIELDGNLVLALYFKV